MKCVECRYFIKHWWKDERFRRCSCQESPELGKEVKAGDGCLFGECWTVEKTIIKKCCGDCRFWLPIKRRGQVIACICANDDAEMDGMETPCDSGCDLYENKRRMESDA